MNTESSEIKTLPAFERLVQPMTRKEKNAFLSIIRSTSSPQIIHIWHGTHLIDKDKYDICCALNKAVKIEELNFESWINAAVFICNCEMKRPSLNDESKKYLIGQLFNYRIMLHSADNETPMKKVICEDLGKELSLAAGTVLKYSAHAAALNTIFDQSEELARRILAGKLRISHENLIELSRLRSDEIRSIANTITTDNVEYVSLSYIRNEVKWSHVQNRSPVSKKERAEKKVCKHPTIRQMPTYDPDSEVNSLCMTIDSWISSMQRVKNSENFSKITYKASLQLMKKLSFLEHTINAIQESLVERTNS